MRRDPSCVRGLLTAWPQSLEFKYLTNQRRPTEDNMRGSSKSWQGKKMLQEKTSEGLKDRPKMKKQSENFPSSFNKFLQLHSKSKKASLQAKWTLRHSKHRRSVQGLFGDLHPTSWMKRSHLHPHLSTRKQLRPSSPRSMAATPNSFPSHPGYLSSQLQPPHLMRVLSPGNR